MYKKLLHSPFRRILMAVLVLCFLFSLIPTGVLAEETNAASIQTENGLHLDKTAVLSDDGTYTITMEAYATGTVTTETERKPVDIIIVMDVSGSMVDPDWATDEAETWQLYEGWASTAMTLQDSRGDQFYHKHGNDYHAVTLVKKENYTGYVYGYSGGGQYFPLTNSYGEYIYYENKDVYGYICSETSCKNAYGYVYNPSYYSDFALKIDGYAFELGNLTYTNLNGDRRIPTSFALYRQTSDITRMEAMQTAINEFIATTAAQNQGYAEEDQHRIALVKYAGLIYLDAGTGNEYYSEEDRENNIRKLYSTYQSGLTNLSQVVYDLSYVNSSTASAMQTQISNLHPAGATYSQNGMYLANEIVKENMDSNREQIILFFTDGEPTTTTSFETAVANGAINYAKTAKTEYNTKIYAINMMPEDAVTADMTKYMNYVSSNYPAATSMTASGTQSDSKYYKQVHDMADLNELFEEISRTVDSTDITLDANAQLRDYMAEGFQLTDSSRVVVQTVDYAGNGTWSSTPTVVQEYPANDAYADSRVSIDVDTTNQTVFVKGFSYKDNYVLDASGSIATQGKKLVVTITGVEATDAAVQNQLVPTNLATSGIYPDSTSTDPAGLFPVPRVLLTSKVYVLDFARPASLAASDWQQTDVRHLDSDGMNYFSSAVTWLDMAYGAAEIGESAGTELNYYPQTMQWDGYDSVYVFGKDADSTSTNIWSRVSVLPANNVYYEDDFVAGNLNAESGIVYTDGSKPTDMSDEEWSAMQSAWETTGSASGGREDENGSVHGWISDLSGNTGFADGTAHIVDSVAGQRGDQLPSAKFTFTGTGVDIYSFTDSDTGTILVTVKNTQTNKSWYYIVDNYAASGSYYHIPTVTFSGDYATYDVKITVTTGAASKGRFTYYLDGVRVYKPLGDQSDDTISGAYGDEMNAVFTEVRNDLLVSGAVFIDKDTEGTAQIRDYATYGDYAKYAPEHEVYLASGETVSFKVNGSSENHYFLGLKALSGQATSAEFSFGVDNSGTEVKTTQSIGHTTDLYYRVIPNNGIVTIENTGSGILAITKLRQTGAAAEVSLLSLSEEEAMASYKLFMSMPLVSYSPEPKPAEPEETQPPTEPEETEAPTEPEETEVPTEPEETEAPTEPEETEAPTEPEETEAPTKPEETEAPTEPEETEAPTEPEETEAPTEPEETEAPTEPEETEAPTEPEETEAPTEPEHTQKPTEPDSPEIDIFNPDPVPEGPSAQELFWNLIKMMMQTLRGWFIR